MKPALVALLLLSYPALVMAQEAGPRQRLEAGAIASLGGPASAPAQQVEDRIRRLEDSRWPELDAALDPIEKWKERFREDTGLSLSFDYQTLYQHATHSLTNIDHGTAGQARILGNWTLFDRFGENPGSLVFILENRHALGHGETPTDLAENIGYIGANGLTFSDAGSSLSVAYWQQRIFDGAGGIVAGRIDPADYLDILGYVNPRTTFQNLAVTYNPVLAIPDPGFGIGAGTFLTDQIYTLGVVSDANGSLTNIDWFPGGHEYFTYGEIGWTPARDQRYLTNVHVGFYHIDERVDAGVPGATGVVLSANYTFDNNLMLFGRLGWSQGDAPIASRAAMAGFLWRPGLYDDLIGFAGTIAQPVESSLETQTTLEAFYRYDLSDNLALTADVQHLIHPGANNENPWIFGLRLRFNL